MPMTPRQILWQLIFITMAVFSGCALLQPDCAQDWYDTGQREGSFGAQLRDVQYGESCGRRFDRSRYVSGWQAGVSARPSLGGQ